MIIFLITGIPTNPNHPANMKDSAGEGGQHTSKKVLKRGASFSEELLAHRCGISDVIFSFFIFLFCTRSLHTYLPHGPYSFFLYSPLPCAKSFFRNRGTNNNTSKRQTQTRTSKSFSGPLCRPKPTLCGFWSSTWLRPGVTKNRDN